MTRVAVIGTGFWGAKLAEAAGRSTLELAACYSRDPERRAGFAERFGCDAAGSYEEALDAADAVLVVGSSLAVYSGYRLCERAHAAGKPIAAVNRGVTRADPLLSLKVDADCAEALAGAGGQFVVETR
jgi:predicted dehydrogenase